MKNLCGEKRFEYLVIQGAPLDYEIGERPETAAEEGDWEGGGGEREREVDGREKEVTVEVEVQRVTLVQLI